MTWRNCNASMRLVEAVNAKWPNRDKTSDGTIGDAAHATRASDHNPWVIVNGVGVVRARDIDKDGIDAAWLAEELRKLGAAGDPRLAGGGYVIFNRRITSPDFSRWNVYNGSNPHTSHIHVSFSLNQAGFDSNAGWAFLGGSAPATGGIQYEARVDVPLGQRILSVGKVGPDVAFVQRWHGITDDGYFGPATKAKVEETQRRNKVAVDGVVGPVTWGLMGIGKAAPAPAPAPAPQPWLNLPDIRKTPRKFQMWYNAYPFKPALLPIIKPLADNFGPQSVAALKKVQARYGLAADGIFGPKTKKLFWDLGWRG